MTKRGKKSAILQQLYKQDYNNKTAQNYIESPQGKQQHPQVYIGAKDPNHPISRSKYYSEYQKYKKGTVTTGDPTREVGKEAQVPVTSPSTSPLKIQVGGEETPLQQLNIIHPEGAPAIGADGQVVPQLMTGDQFSGFFTAIKENYPEKYQWSERADKLLGAAWAPVINRWIQASSENFLLGFAIVCTLGIIIRPTILSIKDWSDERKRREKSSPVKKRAEKALEKS